MNPFVTQRGPLNSKHSSIYRVEIGDFKWNDISANQRFHGKVPSPRGGLISSVSN